MTGSRPPDLRWSKGRPLGCVCCGLGCWSNDGVLPICRPCWQALKHGDPQLWPSWWHGDITTADSTGRDSAYFGPHVPTKELAEPFEPTRYAFDPDEEDRDRPDPTDLPPLPPAPSLPGPLTQGTGEPPTWWTADQAATRIHTRYQPQTTTTQRRTA